MHKEITGPRPLLLPQQDPKTALRALLDTLEARVTLLRRGGGGSGAEVFALWGGPYPVLRGLPRLARSLLLPPAPAGPSSMGNPWLQGAGSGEAEGDKHAKVSERLRNVKSGLSSFLHVPSSETRALAAPSHHGAAGAVLRLRREGGRSARAGG